MSWWCKGSTLSRHVRGLGFEFRVRTLFSIDLCCIYLVFTMLLSFLLTFVVFTLCLPCYSALLSACTVKRGAPSTASCLTHF